MALSCMDVISPGRPSMDLKAIHGAREHAQGRSRIALPFAALIPDLIRLCGTQPMLWHDACMKPIETPMRDRSEIIMHVIKRFIVAASRLLAASVVFATGANAAW